MASSLFSLRARQSSRTTSLQVLFRLPLGLGPSTSYSMHFFTQSSSSFRSTCPYQRSLFCCNTNAMSSIPSLSLSSLLESLSFSLTPHIHLTILISARCTISADNISNENNRVERTLLLSRADFSGAWDRTTTTVRRIHGVSGIGCPVVETCRLWLGSLLGARSNLCWQRGRSNWSLFTAG